MPFIRKRDLIKKHANQNSNSNPSQTISTIEASQILESNNNFTNVIERIAKLQEIITEIPFQTWEKETSDLFGYTLDLKMQLPTIQKLTVYRQCMALLAKYQLELKKKGLQLSQENGSLTLSLFRRILDEVNKLTQDEKNDQIVLEANIAKSVFQNLESFASTIENEASKMQKRPTLMRKNSLKKVEELPAIRPTSRGKLSSLSKKDLQTNVPEISGVSKQKLEPLPTDKGSIKQVILILCSIVKNISANSKIRRQLLKDEYLRLLNRYIYIWNDKSLFGIAENIMIQLTATYRHLAVEQKSYKVFLDSNCVDAWARIIELFPTNQDLIFNVLRTISKLSNYESCCLKLNQKKQCIKNLSNFFKYYKSNIHIIIRVAIVFANMTSYLADIRNQLYFNFEAWKDIYVCFDYYATRQLSGKNQVQKMGLSMAAWDYQNIKKQSDIDCIIKIIRLIANLFTVSAIGQDIYINDGQSYKQLVKKLKNILEKKSNIEKSSDLIATILSCLTNILYYDKEILMSNIQYRTIKSQLVHTLVDFVVQIDNEEICCESLRVIANLTRIKDHCKAVIQAKIHEAVFILLQSTSKEIVYYSLGVLINLMVDDDFKQQYKEIAIHGIISILNECENDDFDVVTVGLKTLAAIVESRNQNIDPKILGDIETCLVNLGSHCDRVMSNVHENGQIQEVQQSRSLINLLLNSMPQQKYICPVKNCGRKFADDPKLQDHLKRRHKL